MTDNEASNDSHVGKVSIYSPSAALEHRHFSELPPLSLYIHLPWCIAKCPYCDFNSHEQKNKELPEQQYISALLDDLTQELPDVWGRTLHSVFIGGGTPSLFSPESIERLLSGVRSLMALTPDTEITMEANPGTFEQERFKAYRQAGINRLSLGIQSFNPAHLSVLGRIHGQQESQVAAHEARSAGFDNFNLDLMYGLPGQSVPEAAADLQAALAAEPNHISYYQLTLEPNTLFNKFPPKLPDEDSLWAMQEQAESTLAGAGYKRYEISAWARPGSESVHNTNYWLFGDYIGIGAGAHGKISRADNNTITRRAKQKHPERYLATATTTQRIATQHTVPIADTALEFCMNGLRLLDGFSPAQFRDHTGVDLHHWQQQLAAAEAAGLLDYSALQVKPSNRGVDFLNELLGHFMPEPPA